MCVYLCAVAWLISEQQSLRKSAANAVWQKQQSLQKSVASLCLAEVEGLARKVQRGSAWKAGEFKAQLFGDVAPCQCLQPHRTRNEKS